MKTGYKIFYGLVNYGTQSGIFAKEMRKKGMVALSVTGYDSFKRETDITINFQGKNAWERFLYRIWLKGFLLSCYFKYDIFHFFFGTTLFKYQLDLPFYRLLNKKVVFHYLGVDVQQYKASVDKYETTNIRHYIKDGAGHDEKILKRLKNETKYADLQLVCAPCYSEFVPGSTVLPLAININDYPYTPKPAPQEDIIIMHAPTSRDNKGTSFIKNAIESLIKEGYGIKLLIVENVTHEELREKYKQCDIFIDQILGGWYGTASIEAMAIGRPTVCFLRDSYCQYIDYGPSIPIINANPDNIYTVAKNLLDHKESLPAIGLKSRKFVENIHDSVKTVDKLIEMYGKL